MTLTCRGGLSFRVLYQRHELINALQQFSSSSWKKRLLIPLGVKFNTRKSCLESRSKRITV